MTEEIEVYTGCDNVFADLGFENPDEMLAKAELVRQISLTIEQRNLKPENITKLLGINHAELTDLVQGNLML